MEGRIEWLDTFPLCIPKANHLNLHRYERISHLQLNSTPWQLKGTYTKYRCKKSILWNDTLLLQPKTNLKNTFTLRISDNTKYI